MKSADCFSSNPAYRQDRRTNVDVRPMQCNAEPDYYQMDLFYRMRAQHMLWPS